MKITITGSLGNISKPLAQLLVSAGHQVTVISSNPEKTKDIEAIGAIPAIGSIKDIAFLTKAFNGADAVYTMIPPSFGENNYREYFAGIGHNYAAAIKATGVNQIVNLSSIGAHLSNGTGPIKGLYDTEQILNTLEGVSIKHLRPSYFYTNYYNNIDMIKHAGILGGNYPASSLMVMVDPKDIADVAAQEIQLPFTGKSIRYITSDEKSSGDATALLGAAIGKPNLQWVEFSDEQALEGMMQAGLSHELASNFVEMGVAIKSGKLWEDYLLNKPVLSDRKFEGFAKEFANNF